MSSKELREKATKELAKAIGSKTKAAGYFNVMVAEVNKQNEVAADVDEMLD